MDRRHHQMGPPLYVDMAMRYALEVWRATDKSQWVPRICTLGFMARPVSDAVTKWRKGKNSSGPVSAMLDGLHAIGWSSKNTTTLTDHRGKPVDLTGRSPAPLKKTRIHAVSDLHERNLVLMIAEKNLGTEEEFKRCEGMVLTSNQL